MKKSIVFLVFACLLSVLCACSKADPEQTLLKLPENPASDFKWEYLNEEQTAIKITEYVGTADTVVIPEQIEGLPVEAIAGVRSEEGVLVKGAFSESTVEAVVIPKTVRTVWGFEACKNLKTVLFKEGSALSAIDGFQSCTALESLDLSGTALKTVGSFEGCTALKEIKLPDSVTRIYERAFYECTALESIDLPADLERIDKNAFAYCTSLKRITVPAKLELVNSGDSLIFHDLPALEEIVFEEGRETLSGYGYFEIKTNARIVIPASVKEFGSAGFFIYGSAEFVFKGDFPALVDKEDFYGTPTISYDPETKGWEDCPWRESYTVKPIEQ